MGKSAIASFAESVSSFFSSLTTPNRHADANARSARREKPTPLPTPLNSVTTGPNYNLLSGNGSAYDLSNAASASHVALNTIGNSATSGYVPGSRTATMTAANTGMDIQMQDMSPDGIAPPPPVSDSWRRIDRWTEENYYELYCQLSYGATAADVDSLEYELECTLPRDVRESFYIHDGQDRGGQPTGILFGITLMDIEEVEEEYELWRRVAQSYAEATLSGKVDQAVASHQSSFPPNAVQCVYAHPGWVPLAKDFVGNNIAVDLAPGPAGHWGQVILFGRDHDTKYVVARSWADFLAIVAYDMENGKWLVDEDTNELRLLYGPPREQWSYMDILKYRVRKQERRLAKLRAASKKNHASKQHNAASGSAEPKTASSPTIAATSSPKEKEVRDPAYVEVPLSKKTAAAPESASPKAESKPAEAEAEQTSPVEKQAEEKVEEPVAAESPVAPAPASSTVTAATAAPITPTVTISAPEPASPVTSIPAPVSATTAETTASTSSPVSADEEVKTDGDEAASTNNKEEKTEEADLSAAVESVSLDDAEPTEVEKKEDVSAPAVVSEESAKQTEKSATDEKADEVENIAPTETAQKAAAATTETTTETA